MKKGASELEKSSLHAGFCPHLQYIVEILTPNCCTSPLQGATRSILFILAGYAAKFIRESLMNDLGTFRGTETRILLLNYILMGKAKGTPFIQMLTVHILGGWS